MAQPRTISRLFCRSSSSKIVYTPAELPTAFPSPMCTVTSWIIRKQIHCYITPHFNEIILFKDLFLPYFVVIFTVPRETSDFSFWHVKISLLIHFRYLLLALLFQTAKIKLRRSRQICWKKFQTFEFVDQMTGIRDVAPDNIVGVRLQEIFFFNWKNKDNKTKMLVVIPSKDGKYVENCII